MGREAAAGIALCPISRILRKYGGALAPLSMAAMGAALSDSDLASVLTYIRNSWGNKADAVTADDVKQVRAAVSKTPGSMTGDQLMKMPE